VGEVETEISIGLLTSFSPVPGPRAASGSTASRDGDARRDRRSCYRLPTHLDAGETTVRACVRARDGTRFSKFDPVTAIPRDVRNGRTGDRERRDATTVMRRVHERARENEWIARTPSDDDVTTRSDRAPNSD